MDDSHIGTEGVVTLICILGLKFALLTTIADFSEFIQTVKVSFSNFTQDTLIKTLLFIPVSGRWAMVIGMFYSKPARAEGLGKIFIEHTKTKRFLLATLFVIILSYLVFQLKGIIAMVVIFALVIICVKLLTKKIGGMTGDTIGAIGEITEIAFLICVFLLCNSH